MPEEVPEGNERPVMNDSKIKDMGSQNISVFNGAVSSFGLGQGSKSANAIAGASTSQNMNFQVPNSVPSQQNIPTQLTGNAAKKAKKSLFVKVSDLNEVQEHSEDEIFSNARPDEMNPALNRSMQKMDNLPIDNIIQKNAKPISKMMSLKNALNQGEKSFRETDALILDSSPKARKNTNEEEKKNYTENMESFGNKQQPP